MLKLNQSNEELDHIINERDTLLLKLNQSNEELNRTRKKLDKAEGDINKFKEIKEKYDYQSKRVKRLKSELNKKIMTL